MSELLITTWAAIVGVTSGLWSIVEEILVWGWSVLHHLHTDAPRLEGLLIGILLTWFLLRRDRHPLLRLLSSPLKLIVDILDLAWDQVIEIVSDVKETIVGWAGKVSAVIKGTATAAWNRVISVLTSVKDRLSKKADEEG